MIRSYIISILFWCIFGINNAQSQSLFSVLSINKNSITTDTAICEQKYIIQKIEISGNKKTKEFVIQRELNLQTGDTINPTELKKKILRSKQNLLNTPLFNYVVIDTQYIDNKYIILKVNVEERWYTWPALYFNHAERNLSVWLENKDMSKLSYGGSILKYNSRGRNEVLSFNLRFGYAQSYSLKYANISLDKKQKHLLTTEAIYYQQHQTGYQTQNNQLLEYKNIEKTLLKSHEYYILYTYRPQLNQKHNILISYNQINIADTLTILNPNFLGDNKNKLKYFTLKYNYIIDRRDARYYPLRGLYWQTSIHKLGLGTKFENINLLVLYNIFKIYTPLASRFYLSNSSFIKKSFNKYTPDYLKTGLGYKEYIRGYEYYVIDGTDYILFKNNIRYNLLPTRIKKVNFIPFEKFNKIHYSIFVNLHLDAAYVNDKNKIAEQNNNMKNSWQYGTGAGIDFITYYDKIIGIDFSVNKQGKTGFYVHFATSF